MTRNIDAKTCFLHASYESELKSICDKENMISFMSVRFFKNVLNNKFNFFYVSVIEINYSRLMMPLALSRGILLRPRSERVETKLSSFVSMEACRFVYILANRRP